MAINYFHKPVYRHCSLSVLILFMIFSCYPMALKAEKSRGITMESVPKKMSTPFDVGTYRALIIGNNEYDDKHGRWPKLKTAVTDARAVTQLLKDRYGFSDVKLLENATRRDVLIALESLSKRVMTNDNVLVYYAGHGYMDEDTKKGFWVPVDATGVDHTSFLRNSTIRDELTTISSRVKHTLLISDSCFSGSLLRSGTRGIAPLVNTDKYYKKVSNKKSVQIMTAGGVEFVDDDYKNSGHSPFTYFLLSELKNNHSPMLTVSELSSNVGKAVANNVDQVPESGVLQGAGDELGEFIFIKMNVSVHGVPADKVKIQVNVVPEETVNKPGVTEKPVRKNMPDVVPIPTL